MAWIQSLAQELPYVVGMAIKLKKKKKPYVWIPYHITVDTCCILFISPWSPLLSAATTMAAYLLEKGSFLSLVFVSVLMYR